MVSDKEEKIIPHQAFLRTVSLWLNSLRTLWCVTYLIGRTYRHNWLRHSRSSRLSSYYEIIKIIEIADILELLCILGLLDSNSFFTEMHFLFNMEFLDILGIWDFHDFSCCPDFKKHNISEQNSASCSQ